MSMMTGVFHFMAISLGSILARRKLWLRRHAVNRRPPWLDLPPRFAGGFVGIHSASDTEYKWPWYGRLVGTYFASHPAIQRGTVRIADASHPSTDGLPQSWERTDES